MTPMKVLDYIVVHELAHLVHRNHTDAFWALVDRVLPDYRERKEWLQFNWAGMDLRKIGYIKLPPIPKPLIFILPDRNDDPRIIEPRKGGFGGQNREIRPPNCPPKK